ncbi:pre-mRNA-splicing factor cwc15, putative [Pediculus humanus corporis]|uniref:Pre-mRNA-splicing factor cwc15, putative n=1 Tax=Pediculus humanus subsp. corporis TaxID=121224 RepID=E0VF84_PEDHC|nr:pre-mRNA-splicing factor cwc15, putative [Pediculus humanus corporis]EEB12040.1 pre-mRNA-splicing factor cwc15, putative [Pediculus humanus corporis]
MTTAARPTFEPARGGQGRGEKDLSAISKQYSSRDLPSHTKLKFREHGQGTSEELRSRDFRRELEDREHEKEKSSRRDGDSRESKRVKLDQLPAASLDADDPLDEDDDSDENESDDDTAALMAELSRIKKERAAENARKEAEKRQEEERIRMENILSGNPLLNYAAQATKTDIKVSTTKLEFFYFIRFVKRRWDDDVVFKNCARSEPEKKKDNFINDSLRSDFHRKFMEKYVK